MIRMYWWQGGGGTGNFGDKLAPALVAALSGQRVQYSAIEKSDLLAIGSLLEPWFWPSGSWLDYRGHIWGPGRMFGKGPLSFPHAQITSVRGELTLSRLDEVSTSGIVVGDPGLLCGHIYYPHITIKHKVGLWPHWSEVNHPKIRQLLATSSEFVMIDPCSDIKDTLDKAASCEFIAATSLHGLVIADALAIPSCWLRLDTGKEDANGMPAFKYLDYFSAFQSPPPSPRVLVHDDTLDSLLPLMNSDRHADVARLQDDLLSVFPFRRPVSAV